MTSQELRELRDLHEKAAPGPWIHLKPAPGVDALGDIVAKTPIGNTYSVLRGVRSDDLAFIAKARTALPKLIDEIERLRAVPKEQL